MVFPKSSKLANTLLILGEILHLASGFFWIYSEFLVGARPSVPTITWWPLPEWFKISSNISFLTKSSQWPFPLSRFPPFYFFAYINYFELFLIWKDGDGDEYGFESLDEKADVFLFLRCSMEQVMAYLLVTSVAAVLEMAYLAYKGDRGVTWSEACTSYGQFCGRMAVALALHAMAFCCFLVLAVISAFRVFSIFGPPDSDKEQEEERASWVQLAFFLVSYNLYDVKSKVWLSNKKRNVMISNKCLWFWNTATSKTYSSIWDERGNDIYFTFLSVP